MGAGNGRAGGTGALPDQASIEARVAEAIAANADREGPLLPMLHDIQAALGCVPEAAVPLLAAALKTTTAEVHGTISFYHDFKRAPEGRHVLRLCRAESCKSKGADALHEEIKGALGLDWHETSGDGRLTLEPVYCLGLCACSPSAMLDDRPMGRVDAGRVLAAVGEVR